MKYYVDKRMGEVVREDELDFNLAPELFYEYKESPDELIHEEWFCANGKFLTFSHEEGLASTGKDREEFFKSHDTEYLYLVSYSVISEWYKEIIEECEEDYEGDYDEEDYEDEEV